MVFCRVSHIKNSSSSNPNLRTFNMFEGVKQPSYSRTKTRSLSPMPSSHLESPSSSTHSPIQNKSLSPQPQTNVKRRGTVLLKLYSICLERIALFHPIKASIVNHLWVVEFFLYILVPPVTDSPSGDTVALSKRSRTQVYSGRRSGFSGKQTHGMIIIMSIVLYCRCSYTI